MYRALVGLFLHPGWSDCQHHEHPLHQCLPSCCDNTAKRHGTSATFATPDVLFLRAGGHIDLTLARSVSSLTDSSVCTGNLCGKIWPYNRRLVQKGECPMRGGGRGRVLDWNELIVSSCSAGSRHDIVLLFFLIYCNSLHVFFFSLSMVFPSLSVFTCIHVLLTLASTSSLPLC